MTSTDIVRIIKACKESGISTLEYMGLVLKFGEAPTLEDVGYAPIIPNTMNLVDNTDVLTHNEKEEEEEDDELLKLSDPLMWEQGQMNG